MKPGRTKGKPTIEPARHPHATDVLTDDGIATVIQPEALVTVPEDNLALEKALTARPKSKWAKRGAIIAKKAYILLAGGDSVGDVAEQLGVSRSTLTKYLTIHKREVELDTITDKLDRIAVPLAADNLIHGLMAGDKDYTIKTLEGRGHFRKHTENRDLNRNDMPPLRIEFYVEGGINNAHPSVDSAIAGGTARGNIQWPKGVQGTVIDSQPLLTERSDGE